MHGWLHFSSFVLDNAYLHSQCKTLLDTVTMDAIKHKFLRP